MPSNKSGNNKKNKKQKRKIFKIIGKLILWGIVLMLGLGVGVIYSIFNGAGELPLDKFKINNFTTVIYDKDGNEYGRLDTQENRIYVDLGECSPYLPKAFIAIEDERFEKHFGIDVKRTGAAVVTYILNGGKSDFGGSTITQQLIKKVTNDQDRSWQRKVREMVRAIQLENNMSKDQIIELYMNIIYLGEGAYGVETAAHTYFNKTAKDLTIAECAMIGGLAQAPSSVNPFSNYEAAKKRQGYVLSKMYELEYITKEQYEEAKAEDLTPKRGASVGGGATNSYFVDAVVDEVINDLNKTYGLDKGEAQRMVYSNGYKIYTTVDPKVQSSIEEIYKDQNYFKLSNGNYDENIQSAMVIIDYRKGNVVGLVGGTGEKTTFRGLNRATQSARSPGSTMKPLGVYGPALHNGVVTSAKTYDEVPTTFKTGIQTWTPTNNGRYRGLISVRKAIAASSNVVAAKTFMDLGAAASRTFLQNLGISTLTSSDVSGGSLALGGLTKGIIPIEHAAAYGTFANGGIYMEPKLYTKVVDQDGNTILEKFSDVKTVMSKENAYIMTDMLEYAVNYGTGGESKFPNMRIAGKTGTTNDSKDRWFGGYTPYYVASVWVGYDQPKTISMSGNPAAKIWKAVMQKVHEGLETKAWTKPDGVISVEVCADSGLLPTDLCKNDPRGSRVVTELFTKETVPTEYCEMHVEVEVCPETFLLKNPECYRVTPTYSRVYLNKSYPEVPSKLPEDYDYIIPTESCTLHTYSPSGYFGDIEDVEQEDDEDNFTRKRRD